MTPVARTKSCRRRVPFFTPGLWAKATESHTTPTPIQRAIDACAGTGGSVVLRGGAFLSAHLTLKGQTALDVNGDATLLGGTDPADYPEVFPAGEVAFANRAACSTPARPTVWCWTARGRLTGRAKKLNMVGLEPTPPSIACTCLPERECDCPQPLGPQPPDVDAGVRFRWPRLDIDALNVQSPRGYSPNLDGMDICNSRNMIVHNCVVNSEDDAICLKSQGLVGWLRNVLIENNTVRSFDANGFKIGTFTFGPITDITFRNNTVRSSPWGACALSWWTGRA